MESDYILKTWIKPAKLPSLYWNHDRLKMIQNNSIVIVKMETVSKSILNLSDLNIAIIRDYEFTMVSEFTQRIYKSTNGKIYKLKEIISHAF